jgi:hypothetical protein
MGKIRRGGCVFITWIGDYAPRHMHVYRDGEFVVKWDLEHDVAMKGTAGAALRRVIEELREEGKL